MSKFNERGTEFYFSYDENYYSVDVVNFDSRVVEEYPNINDYIFELYDIKIEDGRKHALYSFGNKDSIVGLS